MTTIQKFGAYQIGSSRQLTALQLQKLADLFNQPTKKPVELLAGRSSASVHQIHGIGRIVIKYYTRGGLLYRVIKRRFLKWGKPRGQHEFELLGLMEALGINVPQPIAYAHRGRLLYQTWLVTRAIHQSVSLARLSRQDEKTAGRAMHSVIEQVCCLIHNNILHVDLLPGYLIVDGSGKVYLLDFDKGRVYQGNRKKLRNRYITRWQRAVDKHGLPKFLSEMMQIGLE